MEEIQKGLYSRFSRSDTAEIFLNRYNLERILVTDLDGTLYRGKKPEKYRGVSLIEFSKSIAYRLSYRRPHKLPGYISGCLDTRKLEKNLKCYGFSKSELEGTLIDGFFNNVIKGLPYNLIEAAGRSLPKRTFPYSKRTILNLGNRSKDTVILTKNIYPVVKPFIDWFNANGLEVGHICNHLEVEAQKVKGLKPETIKTREDKRERTSLIAGYETALVFGDTDEDLGISEGLQNIPHHIVAVNGWEGHSEELIKKADFFIEGWEGLHSFLGQNLENTSGQ